MMQMNLPIKQDRFVVGTGKKRWNRDGLGVWD